MNKSPCFPLLQRGNIREIWIESRMPTLQELISARLPFIPPERLFGLLGEKDHFIWLDTCLSGRTQRYSLMAFAPFLVFRSKGRKTVVSGNAGEKRFYGDPFEILNSLLKKYHRSHPGFFSPGALGFFSYDLGWQIEKLPDISKDDLKMPDIYLGFYDTVLLIDSVEKNLTLLSANLQNENARNFKLMFREKADMIRKIAPGRNRREECAADIKKFSSNLSYRQYVKSIEKIKNYIASGDVYQINFAQRLEAEGVFLPEAVYAKIRKVNPTSFSGYFNAGEFQLLSNSPEIFLRKEGSKVMTKPMKGTRPRGLDRRADERYRKELMESAKDRAELVMIIDLERNDIGKVCRYGTVRVRRLRQVESYRTVFQTTSLVEGVLNEGVSQVDLLKATFPGGSITGAPKIRAMEIIEELEPHKRAFYTGSMGYLGFNGNMELNILIRTILLKKNRLYYPVGGGIVWDSSPEAEYEETMTKAKSLFLTLGRDENGKKLLLS